MAGGCCGGTQDNTEKLNDAAWRRVLWIALAINLVMFGVEIVAGSMRGPHRSRPMHSTFWATQRTMRSASVLQAWWARAAMTKGVSILLFGLWVLGNTIWMAAQGIVPAAETMGVVGVIALVANLACAAMLWRHRAGDASRRSVWICSRNDAIGNIAVAAAALGVFGTSTGWPDIAVAAIMAALALSGGWQIIHQALGELRREPILRRSESAPLR